jgi:hypothetical protein
MKFDRPYPYLQEGANIATIYIKGRPEEQRRAGRNKMLTNLLKYCSLRVYKLTYFLYLG